MNTKPQTKLHRFIDLGLKASLLLLALSSPISIAATQTAWALAIVFWIVRLQFVRPSIRVNSMGFAVLLFVGFSLVSSVFSYEPEVSLRKMVAVSLVTIVYLVAITVNDRRMVRAMVALLLIGCVASCVYAIAELAIGKNLKVLRLTADSPLRAVGLEENDTILNANNRPISSPTDLEAAMSSHEGSGGVPITVYRHELLIKTELPANSAAVDMGIMDWTRGRDTRAAGFYGHYTTFAESLQLIGSLALGLLIVIPGGFLSRNKILISGTLACVCIALFLTVTRASWAGFAVAAAVMILIGATRRTLLICIVVAIPIAAAGLYYMQQKRNVSFIDTTDGSTTWRLMVWREGANVLLSEPRHLAVGIGMDSLKTHWQDWHMFDNGRQPLGHLHSTPLQLAFERGLPALLAWLVWMFLYIRMLFRGVKNATLGWFEKGILLGCLGGTIGFLTSGMVHYNWGDSEVVMILYLLMGLSMAVVALAPRPEMTKAI